MHRILLMENHPEVRYIVTEALRDKLSAEVFCAFNGRLALQMVTAYQFDLAFISISKDGSGFNVAHCAVNKEIPVLLTSGNLANIAKMQQSGCPYLAKPYSIYDLLDEITLILARAAENISTAKGSIKKILAYKLGYRGRLPPL